MRYRLWRPVVRFLKCLSTTPPSSDWWPQWIKWWLQWWLQKWPHFFKCSCLPHHPVTGGLSGSIKWWWLQWWLQKWPHQWLPIQWLQRRGTKLYFQREKKKKVFVTYRTFLFFFRRLGYNYASNNAYTSCHFLDKHKNQSFFETYEIRNVGRSGRVQKAELVVVGVWEVVVVGLGGGVVV